MDPVVIRIVCGVLAMVLLGIIVVRRRNRDQQGDQQN